VTAADAEAAPTSHTLTVIITGTEGTIKSSPKGIACVHTDVITATPCTQSFTAKSITLHAYDNPITGTASTVLTWAATGGTIEIRLDKSDGPVIAKVEIPATADWKENSAALTTVPSGLRNLVVTLPEKNNVEIDWVSFEPADAPR